MDRTDYRMICLPCEEGRHSACERYRYMPGPAWCICKIAAHQLCPRTGWDGTVDDEPCRIAPLDHYGRPTGELFCYTHLEVVGMVEDRDECRDE